MCIYTYNTTHSYIRYIHLPSLSGCREVPVLVLSGRAATNLPTPFRDWCKSKSGFSTFYYGTWCLVVPCGLCQARGKGRVPRFREERYICNPPPPSPPAPPRLTSTLYKYTYRARLMQRNCMYCMYVCTYNTCTQAGSGTISCMYRTIPKHAVHTIHTYSNYFTRLRDSW